CFSAILYFPYPSRPGYAMIPSAGSEIEADYQPAAAPWDGSRRQWSLWEMINFGFASAYMLLRELSIIIQVSNHNRRYVEAMGGPQTPAVQEDTKATETMR